MINNLINTKDMGSDLTWAYAFAGPPQYRLEAGCPYLLTTKTKRTKL